MHEIILLLAIIHFFIGVILILSLAKLSDNLEKSENEIIKINKELELQRNKIIDYIEGINKKEETIDKERNDISVKEILNEWLNGGHENEK